MTSRFYIRRHPHLRRQEQHEDQQQTGRRAGMPLPTQLPSPPVVVGGDKQRQVGHGAALGRHRLGAAGITHSVTDGVPSPHAQQLWERGRANRSSQTRMHAERRCSMVLRTAPNTGRLCS